MKSLNYLDFDPFNLMHNVIIVRKIMQLVRKLKQQMKSNKIEKHIDLCGSVDVTYIHGQRGINHIITLRNKFITCLKKEINL